MTATAHTLDRDTLAVGYIAAAKSYLIIALILFWVPLVYTIFLVMTLVKVSSARALYGPDEPRPPQLRRYTILVLIPLVVVGGGMLLLTAASLIWAPA